MKAETIKRKINSKCKGICKHYDECIKNVENDLKRYPEKAHSQHYKCINEL